MCARAFREADREICLHVLLLPDPSTAKRSATNNTSTPTYRRGKQRQVCAEHVSSLSACVVLVSKSDGSYRMCQPQYIKTQICNQDLVFTLISHWLPKHRAKHVWAVVRLDYVAIPLFCFCVSALLSAPVVLCLQELKLVLDPVTGIRSCEFQLLWWSLSWEKHKRRPDKTLVQSTRQRNIQRKRKGQTKNKNIKVI